jgi:hypothetical protein
MKIWKLHERANEYCSFIPCDLCFFNNRFQCKPLGDEWDMPPVDIDGRSNPPADSVSWMSMAPVVSERARDLIEDLVGKDVEFLRFHKLESKPYFVMNVLRCEDYLDGDKSDLTEFRERFVFRADLPKSLPPIFKCPSRWSEIFVTAKFAEMILANKLRGAALANPGEPTMPLILAKIEINRYPGL